MGIQRIHNRFHADQLAGRRAWVPYFTAGFPDRATCVELIHHADRLNAAVIEVGFPYSDSIADGPTIQDSHHKALADGHRVSDTFDLVSQLRPTLNAAVVAMVSFSIVQRVGLSNFMGQLVKSGFDGLLVPDAPIEESAQLIDAARMADLGYIGLIAPTTTPDRRAKIASAATGFIYQIAHAGLTGERTEVPSTLPDDVAHTRLHAHVPVCVGFGVSTPAQVREICKIADGVIVGSAIIRRLQDGVQRRVDRNQLIEEVSVFLMELAGATKGQ